MSVARFVRPLCVAVATPLLGAATNGFGVACGQVSNEVSIDAGGDVGVLEGNSYDGYVLGLRWLSGSNRVRMKFAAASDGSVYGNVIFGDDPLVAPPTDPQVGYPPGWAGDGESGLKGPIEHFPFTILKGMRQGSRVTFAIKTTELWKSWCELQPAVYNNLCLPPGTTNACPDGGAGSCCLFPPDGGAVPMDCEYMKLCSWGGPCTCPSSGCTVDITTNPDVFFDLELSDKSLQGSLVGTGATIQATLAPP